MNDSTMRPFDLGQCWAKTDSVGNPVDSVANHCCVVGLVAEKMKWNLPETLRKILPEGSSTLIAAHDIGKISPGFLMKSPLWRQEWQPRLLLPADGHETRHAWTSQNFLAGCRPCPTTWIMAVGGHHGRYICSSAIPAKIGAKSVGSGIFQDLRHELLELLKNQFGSLPTSDMEKGARLHWFTGFMVFCDWIGSNTTWFPPRVDPADIDATEAKAAKALDEVGIHRHGVASGRTFRDLFG